MSTIKYVVKKLSELTPAPYNARKISKQAKIGLTESLERFGLVQNIVYNKTTGNIVGGHQRFNILKEKGIEETEVIELELSEEDEKTLNMGLNNPAIQGEWTERIDSLLDQIRKADTTNLFGRLKFDTLQAELDKAAGINMSCPCCDYKWTLKKNQARIATESELNELEPQPKPVPLPSKDEQQDVQNFASEMEDTDDKEE